MEKLKLTCTLSQNPRTAPVISGEVAPQAIELKITPLFPSEMFLRQLRDKEFDVSEMSLSSLAILTAKGLNDDWVGIPVYTTRHFFHTQILIRTDRGIDKPSDLAGKKVGVPEYQQTAALWTRAALRSEYGVDPRSMKWWMERDPARSHGGSTGFTPPAGIDLQYLKPDTNLGEMLVAGELDALIHFIAQRNLVDRSTVDPLESPHVRYLFPDRTAEAKRYYEATNIYPINHAMIVRRSIAERYPWVILNIFHAMQEAKDRINETLAMTLQPYVDAGILDPAAAAATTTDVMPYGIKRARHVLETIAQSVYDDGLAPRVVGLDELFARQTLDL